MSYEHERSHAVMEGGGSYNRHARVPAGGGNLALPFLEQAAQDITLEGGGDQPVVIADYGSSQGKEFTCSHAGGDQSIADTCRPRSTHLGGPRRSAGKRLQ